MKKICLLTLALALAPFAAEAQSRSWTAVSGSWDVAGNWTPNSVPGAGVVVYISNSGTAIIGPGVSATAGSVFLGAQSGQSGFLTLNGGSLVADSLRVGSAAGSNGGILMSSGTMSVNSFMVGSSGTGTLVLSGGLLETEGVVSVGFAAGADGTMTVNGGTWSSANSVYLGYDGAGTLNINGGLVDVKISNNGFFGVGAYASGTLSITGGLLRVEAPIVNASIGRAVGVVGTATVTSGTWINLQSLDVGFFGTGLLTVNSGLVSTGASSINMAVLNGSSGSVTLNGGLIETGQFIEGVGTGLLFLNGGTLRAMGNQANFLSSFETGDVTINSGGAFIDSNGFSIGIGTAMSGTGGLTKLGAGTLTLTGSNSYAGMTIVRGGTLAIGSGGVISQSAAGLTVGQNSGDVASMVIGSGRVSNNMGNIGQNAGAVGSVTVNGGGWNNAGSLTLGSSGTGRMTVNSGTVTNTNAAVGGFAGSYGEVTVNGGSWINSGDMSVGYAATGSMTVTGGLVSASSAFLASNTGTSVGTVTVSGGTWSNGSVFVGVVGTGVVNLTGTGVVSASGTFMLGANGGSTGTLNIGTGGTAGTLIAPMVVAGSGGGTVNFNHTGSLSFVPNLLNGSASLTVNHIGSGTTILTGSNTYAGGTYVQAGVLRAGNANAFVQNTGYQVNSGVLDLNGFNLTSSGFSGAGGMVNLGSATFTVNQGFFSAYSGTISGGGGLTVTGNSSLRLNGLSNYSGATLVQGNSTLTLSGTRFSGSSAVTVEAGSLLNIGASGDLFPATLVGSIAGDGQIFGQGIVSAFAWGIDNTDTTWAGTMNGTILAGKRGTGTTTFTGANSILQMIITEGGIKIGSGGSLGNTALSLLGSGSNSPVLDLDGNNLGINSLLGTSDARVLLGSGTLTLSGSSTIATNFSGTISGSGSVVKNGRGALILDGDNTFTGPLINSGTVQIGTSGTSSTGRGSVVADIVNNNRLIYGVGFTSTYNGIISGTGAVTKQGTGSLTLTGSNTYSGTTAVAGGKLVVNGVNSGTGAVTVQNGATLGGSGSIGGAVTVQNGGTLATGNSVGTLTVATASFESGSLFSLEGDGAFFDSLVVGGNVTLQSGALISFTLLNPLTASSYTLISAAGGLDGSVQFTLSGAIPSGYQLEYTGTALNLVQVQATIGPITATPDDTTIITGGTTSVVVTVANSGTTPGGADLDATVTGDGTTVSGTGTAVVAQGATGTAAPDLAFSSTTIGVQTGTVTVTDPDATNSPQTGTVTVNVLDHADPILTVSGGNSQSVIVGATGITATLNLANGTTGEANLSPMDVGNLSTGLSGTTGSGVIGSGASADYTASLNTGTVGAGQNQVYSLDAGDQQSLAGANPLSTYSATVALNVYGHAEPVVSGSTFNLGYIHEGYTAPVVSNTIAVTNGATGDYIVDLKADGVTSGDLSLNGISGVGAGDSAGVAVTLGTGLGVGSFGGVLVQTYADDSSLAGASSNVGTVSYSVTGEVYSGHGVWNIAGGGSWGTFDSGFGVNWQAGGGSPGLDAAFASTDTATFGTAGSGVVTLDGAAPSLKAVTFDNASASYEIAQGTGGVLTLNGGTSAALVENLNGNHAISAPLQLATNALFRVANTADRLTISGSISGSGNVEVGGAGRTVFTQSQSYAGTTTVTSGVLASRNLTGGAVNLNGGLFSPGNSGTTSTITVSTLNLNGGGLEFDLGAPGASDGIIVTGTTTLNAATQFTFLDAGFSEGVFTLVQSGTLANFGNLSGLTFVSDIDGLQGLFGVDGNTLYFRGFTEDTIFTGPVLSNYAPYLIPTTGKFLVDGPVTTWPEDQSNTIDSLIFKNGSSLFVFNDLTVTSGDFTVRRGSATIDGGRVIVPGDFNLIGKGTLIAGSEFAIGGDANVNGGNLVINGLFNAGGNMNVHSTVTVNGNAQVAGNLNTDDSEIVVNGIFGIGKSANISNSSSLLVNNGGVMNVAQATNIGAGSSAQINGLLTSPQVNVSGLLKGTGVIAGNVWNNGIVAPGNSPGVLSVNGNYAQTSNGTLQIELGDLLLVSGNASLAGQLQLIAAGKLKYGQQITFLQAGSISGEFDEILVPNPSKNRGRVLTEGGVGTLLIAPTSYTLVAETSNQRKVATALNSFIPAKNNDREVVSTALDLQAAEQYPAAFDQIAPTYYESLGNITIEQAFVQSQQLNQRLSAVRLGARGFQAIGIESPLRHDKDGKSVFEAKEAKKNIEVETETNWNIWAMGNGTFARVTGIGQLPNYSFNSGGFLVGGDYRWSENFATGLYGGYQYTWADAGDSGNTQINSALFGGYASYQNDGFYADGIVGGGYNGYRVRRGINFSTVDRTARSQPNGGQFNASLNLGYDWEIGKFTLGPIAGVQYTYAGIAPFSETGADSLDLRVAQQNVNSLRTTFGGRVAYTWNVTDKIALIPEVRMFWQHEFLNNPRNISSALDGGSGPTFGYETSAPARDSVFAGAGISAQFGERWNAFFYWNVDFGRQDYFGNSISGGLNWKF